MGEKSRCNKLGEIGELKAQLHFAKLGYEIYTGSTGNLYYDFVAVKARKKNKPEVLTVEVKSTTTRNKSDTGWTFNIRKSYGDLPFDKTKLDYMAFYIDPIDELVVVEADAIDQVREYLIYDTDLIGGTPKSTSKGLTKSNGR